MNGSDQDRIKPSVFVTGMYDNEQGPNEFMTPKKEWIENLTTDL